MVNTIQDWRQRNGMTQVEAAAELGVSQTYLSLLEKGLRPMTAALRGRMRIARKPVEGRIDEGRFRRQLSSLGYPGFAHIARTGRKARPEVLLLEILSVPDVDARIAEALVWVVRHHEQRIDFDWLVTRAKMRNLQNRLGFLLQVSGITSAAVRTLEAARLLQEATFCWDSMPAPLRNWMRSNRTAVAAHWNIVTRMDAEANRDAA